jgi:hypothetical protein
MLKELLYWYVFCLAFYPSQCSRCQTVNKVCIRHARKVIMKIIFMETRYLDAEDEDNLVVKTVFALKRTGS